MNETQKRLLQKSKQKTNTSGKLAPKQRIRTMAQGLTLGFADELEAYTKSMMTGQPVEEILEEIRGGLEAYKRDYPKSAFGYEALGAVAPTIFTAGGGAPITMGRLAARGALEGGAYAYGTGEGGVGERAARVPSGIAFGASGGVVGGKVAQYGGKAFEALIDNVRRTTGRRGASVVENEIQRLAETTGKSADEIAEDIINGKIMAENRTLIPAIKALRGEGGPAAEKIQTALETRPKKLRKEAEDEINRVLSSGDTSTTAVRQQRTSEAATREAENKAYGQFKGASGQGDDIVSQPVFLELSKILKNNPDIGKSLLKVSGRTGKRDLYRVDKDGRVMFSRTPTVLEAETIRRVLKDTAGKEFDAKDFDLSFATQDVEQSLRSILNKEVPELMSVRAQAAAVRANRDAFVAGRKALSKDVNEVEIDVEDIFSKKPEQLASFRAGFLAALQGKFTTGQQAGTVKALLADDRKEGKLLRILVPDTTDQQKIIQKLQNAQDSIDVARPVLVGTQTGETVIAKKAQNAGITMAEGAASLAGDVGSILSVSRKFVNSFGRDLTSAERNKIAEILVSEDADLVRRAITDDRGIAKLQNRINKIIPRLSRGTAQISAREISEPTADFFGPPVETIGGAAGSIMRELTR